MWVVTPWFIVSSAPETAKLIRQAREVNDAKPHYVLKQITDAADQFKKPVIACLGIAFKADIDDLRESPALDITKMLAQNNEAEVLVVEPNINELPEALAALGVKLVSIEEALERSNTLAVLVDHKEFKAIPAEQVARKVVVDSRGIF